jgi:hypothetical protein
MKTLVRCRAALLSFCLAATVAHAEPRTFTSTDGRTVEAEIVSATPDVVTIKLTSGQTLATQISKFSSGDQEYIATWRKEHPVAIKYAFTANYTKDKTGSSKSKRGNTVDTTDTWICKMKIANRSGQTLENVKVNYDIYYKESDGNKLVMRKVSDSASIDGIKHLQEVIVPTKEIKLTTSQLEGGYYYIDGSKSRQRDALSGMTITLQHEGNQVFTWSSNGVPAGSTSGEKAGSLFSK